MMRMGSTKAVLLLLRHLQEQKETIVFQLHCIRMIYVWDISWRSSHGLWMIDVIVSQNKTRICRPITTKIIFSAMKYILK